MRIEADSPGEAASRAYDGHPWDVLCTEVSKDATEFTVEEA